MHRRGRGKDGLARPGDTPVEATMSPKRRAFLVAFIPYVVMIVGIPFVNSSARL